MMRRTLKVLLATSGKVQVRPQVSATPPNVYVAAVVVRLAVLFAAVHETPPSQESCAHILDVVRSVLLTLATKPTSMPLMVAPAGTFRL